MKIKQPKATWIVAKEVFERLEQLYDPWREERAHSGAMKDSLVLLENKIKSFALIKVTWLAKIASTLVSHAPRHTPNVGVVCENINYLYLI